MNRNDRQKKILEIINSKEIETQEELMNALKQEGYETTQATVSRDIRQLGLRKISAGIGRFYVAGKAAHSVSPSSNIQSYKNVLESGVLSVETAGNLVVIKTVSGMAMAVGAAVDNLTIEGVVGCIAGDDTVFVAVRDSRAASSVSAEIRGN